MLEEKEKEKISNYIDKQNEEILKRAKDIIANKMSDKQAIDDIIKITVNRFAPESKIILSSVYDMLAEKTLKESLFVDKPSNEAAFRQMNIRGELNDKFDFNVPKSIDYEESKETLNKWIKSGIVVVVGGVISISLKKFIPICISIVIAGIIALVLNDEKNKISEDLNDIIKKYLEIVKKSLLLWVDSIEEYYEEKVKKIKEELENK